MRLLEGVQGTLRTGGHAAYDEAARLLSPIHCGCAAHARRKFFEAVQALPKAERKSQTAAHEGVQRIDALYAIEREAQDLSDTDRQSVRQQKSRPFALGRRNWMFCDTVNGAKASANLYSLVQTCRANTIEPYAYMRRLFAESPAPETVEHFEALLPWNPKLT